MKIKCPTCKNKAEWENNPYRPFCSERCKLIDLGRWASEEYKIAGEEKVSQTTEHIDTAEGYENSNNQITNSK